MLVDVVTEYATEVLRPAAAEADDACEAPEAVLKASLEIGLPILGVPESLGGISEERSAMAGTLVAEALAKGDLGLAVATLAPGSVATALGLWGSEAQQQTYLPAFTGDDVPAAALALNEPTVLFDVMTPAHHRHVHRRRLRARRRQVAGRPRRPGRALRRRRAARRPARPVPRRVVHARPLGRGRPRHGRARRLADHAHAHRRHACRRTPSSAPPTAPPTPSACGSRGSPGARSPSAPARPCSTT